MSDEWKELGDAMNFDDKFLLLSKWLWRQVKEERKRREDKGQGWARAYFNQWFASCFVILAHAPRPPSSPHLFNHTPDGHNHHAHDYPSTRPPTIAGLRPNTLVVFFGYPSGGLFPDLPRGHHRHHHQFECVPAAAADRRPSPQPLELPPPRGDGGAPCACDFACALEARNAQGLLSIPGAQRSILCLPLSLPSDLVPHRRRGSTTRNFCASSATWARLGRCSRPRRRRTPPSGPSTATPSDSSCEPNAEPQACHLCALSLCSLPPFHVLRSETIPRSLCGAWSGHLPCLCLSNRSMMPRPY